ncbi:MAG: hypothetical protein RLZZ561_779 [Pseudomonadota bacterium]|jgi:uncharacterized membrane protein YfcA
MPFWLIPAFFGTALLYASVGFGGGSTYNALLALAGVDYRTLPAIALTCNIIVVIGGTWRFHRAGLLPRRRALPLVLVSAPFAGLGGLTPITETAFLALLATSLFVAGLALLVQQDRPSENAPAQQNRKTGFADMLTGAGVGYLAGLVGIGGGIFLAPYLHMTRWAAAKQIAATASLFILINSITGLAGQLVKLGSSGTLPEVVGYWPLALAVVVGGQMGSIAGIRLLSPTLVRRATGLLILYVAAQLAWRLLTH